MEKKNPLLAGLLNLLPGAGYLYINNDRERFLKTLLVGIAAIAGLVWLGSAIQRIPGVTLSQSLCTGILLLLVFVPLFLMGQGAANRHNMVMDSTSLYNARQKGGEQAQLDKNQDLRDKGLISKQEYDSRKDDISSKE